MVDTKISNSLWAKNALVSRQLRDPPTAVLEAAAEKAAGGELAPGRGQEKPDTLEPLSKIHLCVHRRPPLGGAMVLRPSGLDTL